MLNLQHIRINDPKLSLNDNEVPRVRLAAAFLTLRKQPFTSIFGAMMRRMSMRGALGSQRWNTIFI